MGVVSVSLGVFYVQFNTGRRQVWGGYRRIIRMILNVPGCVRRGVGVMKRLEYLLMEEGDNETRFV